MVEHKVSGIRRKIVVSSIYIPYDNARLPPTRELEGVVDFARNLDLPVVIGCDSNAHHVIWGSGDIHIRGEALLEYITSTDLQVLNRGKEPIFVNRMRKEVIDFTLVSQGIVEGILGWRVTDLISMSDHRMISFEVESDAKIRTLRRNPRLTNWEVYYGSLGGLLKKDPQGDRVTSERQLDEEVTRLSCSIVSAYEKACPLKAARERMVSWWNRSLEDLRQAARRAFNRAVKGREGATWDEYKAIRREFKNEVRRSKRSGWKAYCTSLESLPEAARLMKILSCEKRGELGSLKRENGTWTTSSEECLDLLLETHFTGEGNSFQGQSSHGLRAACLEISKSSLHPLSGEGGLHNSKIIQGYQYHFLSV